MDDERNNLCWCEMRTGIFPDTVAFEARLSSNLHWPETDIAIDKHHLVTSAEHNLQLITEL